MSILEAFCSVDEFWQQFAPAWERELLTTGTRRRRDTQLHPSEIMTMVILFQQSHYRTFKAMYTEHVHVHLRSEFPPVVFGAYCTPFEVYCTSYSALIVSYSALIEPHSAFIEPVIRRLLHHSNILARYPWVSCQFFIRSDQSTKVRQVPSLRTSRQYCCVHWRQLHNG